MFHAQTPPTVAEVQAQYAIEFGPSSPRLRLTVIDLLAARVEPGELVSTAQEVLHFLTADINVFMEQIAEAMPEPVEDTEIGESIEADNGFGEIKSGYDYL